MEIKDVDMFGYARAGVGTNTMGNDQECFYNQGSGGWNGIGRNEFRLGNECSNYLELGFKFNHIKGETKNAYTQFRIANSHNGEDTTESSSQNTRFVEAFAQIEGMNDRPWSFWVGKKFYRDQDVYIDDYYYFGNMSGNGAGMGNVDLLGGKLSLAYLRQVSSTFSDKGKQGLTIYDARLKDIKLTDSIKQNVWVAFGQSADSKNQKTKEEYKKASGFVVGTLFDFNLWGEGFNHTSLIYGQGVMNQMNVYGNSLEKAGDTQKDTKRLRFINHTTYNLNTKLAYHLSVNAERAVVKSNSIGSWYGVGFRPVYKVTDNFHMVTEVGHSVVNPGPDSRQLTRVTVAPQISVSENIWGRPVLRAFYTHSFWNKANKSFVALDAPSYSQKTSGGAYGFQMESFF